MLKIQLFNASGSIVAEDRVKPYEAGKRFSAWCANNQRKLDKMIATHPSGVRATIGSDEFVVRNGQSSFVMPAD
jgi:hypothetical protein